MNDERLRLLQTIRDIANKKGVGEISLEKLRQNKAIQNDLLNKYYTKDIDLVTDILTEERKKFEVRHGNSWCVDFPKQAGCNVS